MHIDQHIFHKFFWFMILIRHQLCMLSLASWKWIHLVGMHNGWSVLCSRVHIYKILQPSFLLLLDIHSIHKWHLLFRGGLDSDKEKRLTNHEWAFENKKKREKVFLQKLCGQDKFVILLSTVNIASLRDTYPLDILEKEIST